MNKYRSPIFSHSSPISVFNHPGAALNSLKIKNNASHNTKFPLSKLSSL